MCLVPFVSILSGAMIIENNSTKNFLLRQRKLKSDFFNHASTNLTIEYPSVTLSL